VGIEDNAKSERQANKREKSKQARGRRAQSAGSVNWAEFGWGDVIAATETLCGAGGALRIGTTRDGGAWALGVYLGTDYATEYIRPTEDFSEAVREIIVAWTDAERIAYYDARIKQLNGR